MQRSKSRVAGNGPSPAPPTPPRAGVHAKALRPETPLWLSGAPPGLGDARPLPAVPPAQPGHPPAQHPGPEHPFFQRRLRAR